MKNKSKTRCKQCNEETYNDTIDWTGFCSKQCENKFELWMNGEK